MSEVMLIINICVYIHIFKTILSTQFKQRELTHKQQEMHGYILNTLATDAVVLKHQVISIHSADQTSITLD